MNFHFDVQNITDGQGVSIAITGMVIVFFSLSLISLFIFALPSILQCIAQKWPETEGHHRAESASRVTDDAVSVEMVAAIALTLHRRKAH